VLPRRAAPCDRGDVGNPLDELAELLAPDIARCRAQQVPYILAITGSVAVGKSTTARLLCDAIRHGDDALRVAVVSSDGFLLPNRVIDARGLTMRKGFPETYDRAALLTFLQRIKTGARDVAVPLYSHETYDVLDEHEMLGTDDVVILEGLHLVALSEAIDFTVYIDADEADIEQWFVERFFHLRTSNAFYRQFAALSDDQAAAFARDAWSSINGVNLRENILPSRDHADAVLVKTRDHTVQHLVVRHGNMSP
jgi:type I pantothenate kinase